MIGLNVSIWNIFPSYKFSLSFFLTVTFMAINKAAHNESTILSTCSRKETKPSSLASQSCKEQQSIVHFRSIWFPIFQRQMDLSSLTLNTISSIEGQIIDLFQYKNQAQVFMIHLRGQTSSSIANKLQPINKANSPSPSPPLLLPIHPPHPSPAAPWEAP